VRRWRSRTSPSGRRRSAAPRRAGGSRAPGSQIDLRDHWEAGRRRFARGGGILAALSDELGRDVPLAWWFESRTLDELATRLVRFADLDATKANAELAAEDLAEATPSITAVPPRPIRRVLLTGATGFLGAHLVESLRAREVEVTCLVRAPDDVAATGRLEAALASREIPHVRVRAIAGDLGDPELATRLRDLDVDAVIHAGATVSWLASYPALRAPNVRGTRALLGYAASRGARSIISMISTAPRDGDETTRLAFDAAVATTPYALSKWIAEEHVRRAAAAGLPVTIYRPAMIAGHSRRGVGYPEDFLNRYLVGCAELGLYIDRDDAIIDMTPVDFVAEAITALALGRTCAAATYHLANVDQSLFGALGRAVPRPGFASHRPAIPSFASRSAGRAAPGSTRSRPSFPRRSRSGWARGPACERSRSWASSASRGPGSMPR
jgi:nucleoside-diphosphate-sugar epimerase